MRRLVAVAAALGMVALSFAVRARLDDDEQIIAGDGGDDEVTLICDLDLEDVCGASGLAFDEEPSGETAAEFRPGGREVWVTSSAWLDVVDLQPADATLLATSPIVVAALPGAELVECSVEDVACLIDVADERSIGVPEPERASGLAVLGHLVASVTRAGWDRRDLEDVLDRVEDVAHDDDPFQALVVTRGTFDAVVLAEAATNDQADVHQAMPAAKMQIVAVGDRRDDVDLGAIREALADQGWESAEGDVEPLPYVPGALVALLEVMS